MAVKARWKMLSSFRILFFHILPVLLSSSTVSCTALKTQHSCDKINLIESSAGQILSPSRDYGNGNISYPSRVNCAWYIKIQPGSVITLSFSMFDLEEGRHLCSAKPCCGDTWLSILSIPSHSAQLVPMFNFPVQDTVNFLYCGSLSLPPLVFSGSGLILTFKTGDIISGGRGFVLDFTIDKPMRNYCEDGHFHCANGKCILKSWLCNGWDECGDSSDEQNCTVACKTGYSHCSSNSSLCYDFIHGRCNGILDCPGGEDEIACALTCGNQLSCRTRGGCYRSTQRCDGMNDCPDGSDEDGCDAALCGPHRDGFLCRNRHCVTASARCDGVKDCGDFSDEETCMKMSVITAVILGSLICGLLLVIAAGCGLRLYHLRVALEQRWSTIRLQQRTVHQDFDEFGHRRPVMGRLPPPSYAQATGAVDLSSSSHRNISSPGAYVPSQRQRQSNRVRRPAPPLPEPPTPLPLRLSTSGPSSVEVELHTSQMPGHEIIDPPPQSSSQSPRFVPGNFLSRLVRRVWRKDSANDDGGGNGGGSGDGVSSSSSASGPHDLQIPSAQDGHVTSGLTTTNNNNNYNFSAFVVATPNRSDDFDDAADDDDVDTEPLIESHGP
ncbi:low-density lipoprotein receptor-related protein 12-like isoform X2 [Daphnia pulex]|uniref:low-density lipoprotein receptor-related protein 12-like isoform X2 n=1 Tax=Daphnia pulex TaxID=6669 RepID=UPI001EDE7D31|nr:low-density lipoprotein receptor-related protein 12-like isoform X2 [Daphnia pulex]